MLNNEVARECPHLLTRAQAAQFLGIDPATFDKYIRSNDNFKRFMLGRHERYTIKFITEFIENNAC